MAKPAEKLALPRAEDARIRLEGALETVEKARDDYRAAAALLTGQWTLTAGPHRGLLERLRDGVEPVQRASSRVEELAARDGWPPDFSPLRAVTELRAARAALGRHLEQLLEQPPLPGSHALALFEASESRRGLADLLDEALAKILPPARGEPLLRCRLGSENLSSAALNGVFFIVAAAGVALFADLHHFTGVIAVAASLALSVPLLLPYLFTAGKLELFTDRLRRRRLLRQDELPLPRGGIHFEPMKARVRVAGWRALSFLHLSDASSLATLIELLNRPPFDKATSDRPFGWVALDGVWVKGAQPGALLLGPDGAFFVHDGDPTFDAAAGATGNWPNPGALLLLDALLTLPDAERREVLQRLVLAERALPLDRAALAGAVLSGSHLKVGEWAGAAVDPKKAHAVQAALARYRAALRGGR